MVKIPESAGLKISLATTSCVAPTGLESSLSPTQPYGFACARLRLG